MQSSDQDIVTALDELHEGFAIFDQELRLTLCNPSFCLLHGIPQEMCRPGMSLFDLFVFYAKRGDYGPGDAAAQASERIAEISRREPQEVLVDMADGRKILVRYRPIAGSGLVVTYEDVTDIRRVETELKTEADRYELVTRAVSEGVYDWQPIDDKLLVSDRLKSLFDFHEAQFESRHWLERIHSDDRAGYLAAMRAHFKGESDHFEHEYRVRIGGGQYRWVRDQATSLRRKDGRVWRLVGSITDVTELKQREQDLAKVDQQKSVLLTELNAVLDSIDFGVMFMGPDLRGKIINRAFRNIWGVPDEFVETRPTIADVINYNRYNRIYDVPDSEFDAYVAARVEEIQKGY